jgi:hypothetical protein
MKFLTGPLAFAVYYVTLLFILAFVIALGHVNEAESFGLGILLGAISANVKDVVALAREKQGNDG